MKSIRCRSRFKQNSVRIVDERVFEPVGSNQTVPMQARLIAASNRPLEQEVAAGRFRSDLFYRLNGVTFHLPALRKESEIIPNLVGRFIVEFCRQLNFPEYGISPDAMTALQQFGWPGNIRELRPCSGTRRHALRRRAH
ncbi:sigma 54-interacting transcriptional regulator [Hyphomicrobium sp.]|uniref:sigma 54-interacting transcriptional regulator n=1 Tax=Hyphomicrobium sp. TaxID=82 RepID=UPI0039E5462F